MSRHRRRRPECDPPPAPAPPLVAVVWSGAHDPAVCHPWPYHDAGTPRALFALVGQSGRGFGVLVTYN